jgi:hypothetical protein
MVGVKAVAAVDRFMATCSRLECIIGKMRDRWRPLSNVSADSKQTEGCMIARRSQLLSVDDCVRTVTPALLIPVLLINRASERIDVMQCLVKEIGLPTAVRPVH